MQYIVLGTILTLVTLVHAPALKETQNVSHPIHTLTGVSNPFLDQTKGNGLTHEIKQLKDTMDKKKRVKKRVRGWMWLAFSIALAIINPLLLMSIPPLIGLIIYTAILSNPAQNILLFPICYVSAIAGAFIPYAVLTLYTLYAFCKGCTLLSQGYRRHRKYEVTSL